MNYKKYIKDIYNGMDLVEIYDNHQRPLELTSSLNEIIGVFKRIRDNEECVIIIGNGGSCAIAMHFKNDLIASCKIKAITFYSPPLLTACSNDYGYENSFLHQFKLWASPKNLLVAISSSGESDNIVSVAKFAMQNNMRIITLTGFKADNKLKQIGNFNIYVNSCSYGIVEVCHQGILHYISDVLKSH